MLILSMHWKSHPPLGLDANPFYALPVMPIEGELDANPFYAFNVMPLWDWMLILSMHCKSCP
jgi:hypothetical protein